MSLILLPIQSKRVFGVVDVMDTGAGLKSQRLKQHSIVSILCSVVTTPPFWGCEATTYNLHDRDHGLSVFRLLI